ncbi:MAG: ATP-binding protein [Bacteroidales bacterium]
MKELSLHILDIAQNSIRADASHIRISIRENSETNQMEIEIHDNGRGIAEDILPQVTDPYHTSRKTRKVGMGLPLLKHSAEQAGGILSIRSERGKGTTVQCNFVLDHIDRPPLGDIAGVITQLMTSFPDHVFIYEHNTDAGSFELDSREVKEMIGDLSQAGTELRKYLREMINENLTEIVISG